ncbi:hypothetical protein [Noviherbaspirillum aerium]|uniref:hypothetical protein n=1 Tax=Noviherbaspirillum aerium TaxID=2588497 RepID=UPI00124E2448|nr:hypothetical protein [Noviherbaspirillum aerium]
MKITTEMIDAAMRKATEAGLLPRHARREDVSINRELIRMVLLAALESNRKSGKPAVPDTKGGQSVEAAGGNGSRYSGMSNFMPGLR